MKWTRYAAASLLPASLLLACPASAQMQGSPERGTAQSPGSTGYDAGFEDGLRAAMAHINAMVGSRGEGREHEMMGHMKGMHDMAGHEETGGEAGNGPSVKLVRGNARIALKCAADDSTEDCVNAAIVLLNHAAAKEPAQAPQQPQPAPAPAPTPPAGSQ